MLTGKEKKSNQQKTPSWCEYSTPNKLLLRAHCNSTWVLGFFSGGFSTYLRESQCDSALRRTQNLFFRFLHWSLLLSSRLEELATGASRGAAAATIGRAQWVLLVLDTSPEMVPASAPPAGPSPDRLETRSSKRAGEHLPCKNRLRDQGSSSQEERKLWGT